MHFDAQAGCLTTSMACCDLDLWHPESNQVISRRYWIYPVNFTETDQAVHETSWQQDRDKHKSENIMHLSTRSSGKRKKQERKTKRKFWWLQTMMMMMMTKVIPCCHACDLCRAHRRQRSLSWQSSAESVPVNIVVTYHRERCTLHSPVHLHCPICTWYWFDSVCYNDWNRLILIKTGRSIQLTYIYKSSFFV